MGDIFLGFLHKTKAIAVELNEELIGFINELNKHSSIREYHTTAYTRLGFHEGFGYVIIGKDTDVSGEWQDEFKTYYFKSEDFIPFVNSLKSEDNIDIYTEGVLYQQRSLHDPYYPKDDFRDEEIQRGFIKATFKISDNRLKVDDIVFTAVGPKISWRELSVRELHTKEVMSFVLQTLL